MSSPLVLNPFAFISNPVAREGDTFIDILAPRPGRPLAKRPISRAHEPRLYAALSHLLREKEVLAAPEDRAHLREAGILVYEKDRPTWPRYACSATTLPARGLTSPPTLPPAATRVLANSVYFARFPDAIIADPVTDLPYPYWSSERTTIAPAAPASGHIEAARRAWSALVATSREQLRDDGFTTMAGVVPSPHLASLRRYGRALVRGGFLEFDEREGRLWRHDDGVASVFHHILTPWISNLAGEPLKPSYTFLSAFRRGGILRKHTDRPQCEYTVSLLIDFEPFSYAAFPWPIVLELPTASGKPRRVAIRQRAGDMLVFRGRELPHYRPRLRSGNAIHLLFHYVKADFRGKTT